MATVLVVDDNPDACRMMAKLVTRCGGHQGVCVTSGEEALEYLQAQPVALVILDNMMPGMNGIEVLRQMRLRPELADVPVVMWSAIADPAFIEHAKEKGAADYWTKAGFNYSELPQMLGRLLPGGC